MTKIRVAILALFIISWQFIFAQVYPVQVTTQLAAPYSLYLPDYVSPGSERLVVTAFLGDISRPELNVRFKLRIEGQGIILETKPDYIPPPISLQGGVPLRMISSDLAPYFEPRNLNFLQGLTQREFEQQGGKLPEGLYSFCFEVLEYNRGVKISNAGCANAWMILNDPPIINIPRQDEKLKPLNPQNFVIQWTPRHTGSPNSAFNTEYEVTMVEIWPSTRNPNDAILTSPTIFEATTQSTTLVYGPAETPLEPGRRYAFRVRAKSKVGIDELDLFKNHGYSEVYSFTYGDACDLPAEVSAEAFTTRFNLTWDGKFNHTAFKVRYRKAGTTDWYVSKSTFNEASITSLRPSTIYEYQVAGACGWYEGDYTTIATVKTKDEPEKTYSCGAPLETFNLDPSKLTGSLKVGDVINAGDFDVELTKVTGSAGVFSGEAIVVMPMMNKVKVKAEFSNITVAGVPTATDYRMVKGFMNVTGGGIEVIPAGVVDAMDKLVETLDKVDDALDVIEDYIPKKGPDPVSFAADTLVKIDGNILAVVRDPNSGNVIVTTTSGKATTLPPGKNYALTDKDGKGYVVDSKGGVTKTTADVATKASQRRYNFAIQFSNIATPTSPGGFDRYAGNTILSSTYESLDKTYFVPWKASAQNGTGSLTAVLTDRSLDASKVRFEMIDVQGTSALIGDRWTFNITSATTGKIVAYYPSSGAGDKEQILGKVNIQGFDPKPYKLVIVKDADGKFPFTNNDVKVLTDSLNRIYGQALVSWQVSYEERDFNIDKSFDAGNSGLLSNYTADMRKVINAYGSLQNETYYLFVIDKPTNSGDVIGFMPRSQQAGFIYTTSGTTPASFIHTAAHELGHGVFNLKHIFDEFTGLGEKSTKNLMDYTDITSHHFMRFQWERIHDPVTVIGLFEDDEDAALLEGSFTNCGETFDHLLYYYPKEYFKGMPLTEDDLFNEYAIGRNLWKTGYIASSLTELANSIKTDYYFFYNSQSNTYSFDFKRWLADNNVTTITKELSIAKVRFDYIMLKYDYLLFDGLHAKRCGSFVQEHKHRSIVSFMTNQVMKNFKPANVNSSNQFVWNNRVSRLPDPTKYYSIQTGKYNFELLKRHLQFAILVNENSHLTGTEEENFYLEKEYFKLLFRCGKIIVTVGIDDITGLTNQADKIEIVNTFKSLCQLSFDNDAYYKWKTLVDKRVMQEEIAALIQKLESEALQRKIEAASAKAKLDIVIGTASIAFLVIFLPEATIPVLLAEAAQGIYSADQVYGGISTLMDIQANVFKPNKEYKLIRGVLVDENGGNNGATLIYDLGNIVSGVYVGGGNVKNLINIREVESTVIMGDDLKLLLKAADMGVGTYDTGSNIFELKK